MSICLSAAALSQSVGQTRSLTPALRERERGAGRNRQAASNNVKRAPSGGGVARLARQEDVSSPRTHTHEGERERGGRERERDGTHSNTVSPFTNRHAYIFDCKYIRAKLCEIFLFMVGSELIL